MIYLPPILCKVSCSAYFISMKHIPFLTARLMILESCIFNPLISKFKLVELNESIIVVPWGVGAH